jgi:hypothetical protein
MFPEKEKGHECDFCHKSFSFSQSKYRHQKKCRESREVKVQQLVEETTNSKFAECNLEPSFTKFNTCENLIYVIQLREHVNLQENVYKIGRTSKSINKRMQNYPKGSIVISTYKCKSSNVDMEHKLMRAFSKFTNRKDIGNEHFECNYYDMISTFMDVCTSDN